MIDIPDWVFTVLWLIWLGIFIIIEGLALADRDEGDTLSEHVWKWFAIKGKGKWVTLRRLALVTLMVWLTIHFLTGGWI